MEIGGNSSTHFGAIFSPSKLSLFAADFGRCELAPCKCLLFHVARHSSFFLFFRFQFHFHGGGDKLEKEMKFTKRNENPFSMKYNFSFALRLIFARKRLPIFCRDGICVWSFFPLNMNIMLHLKLLRSICMAYLHFAAITSIRCI